MDICMDTEIRHLPYSVSTKLGDILQIGNCWRDVMELIPLELSSIDNSNSVSNPYQRKYSSDNIRKVSEVCAMDGMLGMHILIEEWGTSGKIRPKVKHLIWLLEKTKLERATRYIRSFICPTEDHSTDESLLEFACHIPYKVLKDVTNDFAIIPLSEGGNFIGRGAFGIVCKGVVRVGAGMRTVAIKRLLPNEAKTHNQFINELETLQKCIHKNILQIVGYSSDDVYQCLIYEFMEYGSLFDHLSRSKDTMLPWIIRFSIAEGTAEGIIYLHTNFSPPLVHRDIKSANILLDKNFIPKIGDFGLVRLGSLGLHSDTTIHTNLAIGTSYYMAPEALNGDVSIKLDTYSYGVVLLELLTGETCVVNKDDKRDDLLTRVLDLEDEYATLLDDNAGVINENTAEKAFELAILCTARKKLRPTMEDVLIKLKNIVACHQ